MMRVTKAMLEEQNEQLMMENLRLNRTIATKAKEIERLERFVQIHLKGSNVLIVALERICESTERANEAYQRLPKLRRG